METEGKLIHLRSPENAFTHGCFDDSGADGVNANPFGRVFKCGAFGQADDAVLGRAVRRRSRRANPSGDRRHVDDSSARTLLQHLLQLVLQAEPDALEIDGDGAIPVVFGLLCDWNPVAFNSCVVKGDVEAAVLVDGLLQESLDGSGLRDVGLDEDAFATCGADEIGVSWPSTSRRPATTTLAPSFANKTAVSRPMPEVPPVTMATLFWSSLGMNFPRAGNQAICLRGARLSVWFAWKPVKAGPRRRRAGQSLAQLLLNVFAPIGSSAGLHRGGDGQCALVDGLRVWRPAECG